MTSGFLAVIPARLQSTRLPRKVLADIEGRSMVRRVHDRVASCACVRRIVIATDSDEVEQECRAFGAEVVRTRPDHPSGTDRVAEVVAALDEPLVVNVQADEPLIEPELLEGLFALFEDPTVMVASAMTPLRSVEDLRDPAVVKVVTDTLGDALYFSRAPIPFRREGLGHKHVGVYAFRRAALLRFAAMPPTALERVEGMEQLRLLENGVRIRMLLTPHDAIGVDTPADLERVRRLVREARA
jgi:3-deoxy-manno-octulosonate cytidylyltransferase (CMP-KDO synthetase)